MKNENNSLDDPRKIPLKIAIVGGGRACKFFLELLKGNYFRYLDIDIVGVCDINPEAVGLKMAEGMGIFTTNDFNDFFKLKKLDSIIELTNSRDVLLDLVKLRPKGVGVVEHNFGRFCPFVGNGHGKLPRARQSSLTWPQCSAALREILS